MKRNFKDLVFFFLIFSTCYVNPAIAGQDTLWAVRDTNKIRIVAPLDSISVFVDSVLTIHLQIKDTGNIHSVNLYFQNKTYSVTSFGSTDIFINIQVNSNMIDYRRLTTEAFYLFQDSALLIYDEVLLDIIPNETLTGFVANPEIMHLLIGETGYPEYYAIYQTYSTSTGNFSYNFSAVVDNASIVTFDSIYKTFTGLSQGETFAVVSYQGFSDTIYFAVNGCYGNSSQITVSTTGSTNFCQGDSVILAAPSALYYDWSTGETTQTIQVKNAGTYSVIITDANGCFTFSTQVNVTVNNPPVPVITASDTTVFCSGDSVLLVCDSTNSYLWSNGQTTQSITVLTAGNYSVTVKDTNGCSATSTQTTVTVNPTYNTFATAAICLGDSIFLQGNYQKTAGTYYDTLLSINGCDSVIATTLTVNTTYTIPKTATICSSDSIFLQGNYQKTAGTYYDTLSSINGCDSVIATTLTVNQTFNTPAIAAICSGDSIFLQGNYQKTAGTYYDTLSSINGCDSVIATTLTVNATYTTPKTAAICSGDSIFLYGNYQTTAGIYYDTLVSVNGCDSVIATTLSVNFSSTPTITPSGATTFCQGDSVTLTASAANSYLWSNSATAQSITASTGGDYTVNVTDANGCKGNSIEVTVVVNANPPTPTISKNDTAVVCSDIDKSTYMWYFNDTILKQCFTFYCSCLENGNYKVTIIDNNGCSATSEYLTVTDCAVGFTGSNFPVRFINVYPNPNTGTFILVVTGLEEKYNEVKINVMNILGVSVYEDKYGFSNGQLLEKIDLVAVSTGIYQINVMVGGNLFFTKKVVIE